MNLNKSNTKWLFNRIFILMGMLVATPLSAQENTQESLEWHSFEKALQIAEQQKKPVLVDVWAPWCGWCKKMQKEVYPELSKTLNKKFVLTRLNRDDNETQKTYRHYSMTPLRLAQKFNVQNVPGIAFLSSEGEYLFHISGFTKVEKLKNILEHVPTATSGNLKSQ